MRSWSAPGVATAAQLFAELDDADASSRLIDLALERLVATTLPLWLHGGVTAMAHSSRCAASRVGFDLEAALVRLDAVVVGALSGRGTMPSELMHGVAGVGLYLLGRLPGPTAAAGIDLVLELLARNSVRIGSGCTWSSRSTAALRAPGYAVGMAHGAAGIIAFLARAVERDRSGKTPARQLLKQSMTWLLSQRRSGGSSCFPALSRRRSSGRRLTWCWGDLGIAMTLYVAGREIGDVGWQAEAIDVALLAAKERPVQVHSISLCHGAAGNAHMFNRLFQATGREEFRRAALFWFDALLALDCVRGRPLDVGLWVGTAGAALSLIAALSPAEPVWDGALAMDLPIL